MNAIALKPTAAISRRHLVLAGLILLAAILGGVAAFALRAPADAGFEVPPARAAALVEATAATAELRAVGSEAKAINASLPFSSGPLAAARPFTAGGSEIDRQRALLCLTQAIYYEAGFEPVDGRRAVAQVILNRLRHPAFPKSICGVVYQGSGSGVCQFTFVCDGALYRSPARDAWAQAEQIARAALSGYVEASVGEATHYHGDYVAPRWAPLLAKVAQIGQHIFYRWPGAWGQPSAFTGRYIGEPHDPLSLRPSAPVVPALPGDLASQQVANGPPVPRADNDVGGLLDTSKGWTLHIPGPDESGSAAAMTVATQQAKPTIPADGRALAAATPIAVAGR
jgi:spore germination cell wall hydrolase CwlJ-like protein